VKRCAIVGAGISGLSAAYFLQRQRDPWEIHLYEAGSRIGGLVRTDSVEEAIVEAGPDSFLTQKKRAIELCKEVGLGDCLVGSNDSIRKTFIFHNGELHVLPDGLFLMVPTKPHSFLATDLISWPGKFAAIPDLFSLPEERDLPVSEFIEKRFGKEILELIAEPMLAGIYGADVTSLGLEAALPQIWEMQKKGSLIRDLMRRKTPHPRESLFTTLTGGMESLVNRIREKCAGIDFRLNSPIAAIVRQDPFWKINDHDYDIIVLATSSVPEIVSIHGPRISSLVRSVRRNSAIVVALMFSGVRRDGFGWLVPRHERRSVLACTYLSNKFPARARADRFLVRLFIGSDQAGFWLERSDEEIAQEASRELKRIAGIDEAPLFCRIYRWKDAMPEYGVGHKQLIETLQELTSQETGLYLTGNYFSGVGISDCIHHAEKVVEEINIKNQILKIK
jgi:protoporphyrinogen/coproporphyrinogen III oxidase